MSLWYDRPTKISRMEQGIDYVMCIDENGNSGNLTYILKQISNDKEVSNDDKFFTITGCIFTREEYMKSKNIIKSIKYKYWKNGKFIDNKTKMEKAVCFHSREIRKHDSCFNDKVINYSDFMLDLSEVMSNIECKIISISINLYEYLKLGYTHNVYNVAFDFLLERYIYATKNYKQGVIMLEARGKQEDSELLDHINKVINKSGTKKIKSSELKDKIKGVYFNPKWNEEYSSTYIGLEIADLYSYPIHKFIKNGNKDLAFQVLEGKIDGFPNYINKGIKIFPNEDKK